jgi:hypothetical protein
MQKAKADRQHDIDEHPLMRLALAGIRGWAGVLERNFAYLPKARRERRFIALSNSLDTNELRILSRKFRTYQQKLVAAVSDAFI